jgi:hypothetical protein
MDGLLAIGTFFFWISRIIGNVYNKWSIKGILKKLESNKDYRVQLTDEMYCTIGKHVGADYKDLFSRCKAKIPSMKFKKFEVKGAFDIDANSFLVVVMCNDYDVTVNAKMENSESKFIRIFYFLFRTVDEKSKFEICTYAATDLNRQNLLTDFYPAVMNHINR